VSEGQRHEQGLLDEDAAAPRAAGPTRARIGLVSDTHGWLDPQLAEWFRGVDLIVHAGDVGREEVLAGLRAVAPLLAVRGNIDGGPLADLPLEAVVDVAGVRIAALHIGGPPARPNRAAAALLAAVRPDVLVVGHSHIPLAGRVGEVLWVNPGAAGHEGFHTERTAALLELPAQGEPRLLRVHLGPRGRRRPEPCPP